jgi:hypothetical protein
MKVYVVFEVDCHSMWFHGIYSTEKRAANAVAKLKRERLKLWGYAPEFEIKEKEIDA